MDANVEWDDNLRANLRLWPAPTDNIRELLGLVGQPYGSFSEARALRQTFEAMAHSGLLYRAGPNDTLLPSDLGRLVLKYLGLFNDHVFANVNNVNLIGRFLARGLAAITEVRALWGLMHGAGGRISNEELNRAMAAVQALSHVPGVVAQVLESRAQGDVTIIGDRWYRQDQYGTAEESEQRRAMNPLFLLAGGGGILIEVDGATVMRSMPDWALPIIHRELSDESGPFIHASTAAEAVLSVSERACVPAELR